MDVDPGTRGGCFRGVRRGVDDMKRYSSSSSKECETDDSTFAVCACVVYRRRVMRVSISLLVAMIYDSSNSALVNAMQSIVVYYNTLLATLVNSEH
jgi:hypothetical protein